MALPILITPSSGSRQLHLALMLTAGGSPSPGSRWGRAGRGWESLGAGLGVGVGKKLGRAPGTSWAMSRGSSQEAK